MDSIDDMQTFSTIKRDIAIPSGLVPRVSFLFFSYVDNIFFLREVNMTSTKCEMVSVESPEYPKSRPDGLAIQHLLGLTQETWKFIESFKERICADHPLLKQIEKRSQEIKSMLETVQLWTDIKLPKTCLCELKGFKCYDEYEVCLTQKEMSQIVNEFLGYGLRELQKEHSLHIGFFYNAEIVTQFYSFILSLKEEGKTFKKLKDRIKKELKRLSSEYKKEKKGEIDITKVPELKDKLRRIIYAFSRIWAEELGSWKMVDYPNYVFPLIFDDEWHDLAKSIYVVGTLLPSPKDLLYSDIGRKYLEKRDAQLQKWSQWLRESIIAAYKENLDRVKE